MIFTRSNQPTIENRVDLNLVCLSPDDLNVRLQAYIQTLNYTGDTRVISVVPELMYGFEELPVGNYWIEVHTPRIALWLSAKDKQTTKEVIWYDAEKNQLAESIADVEGDSLMFLTIPNDTFKAVSVTYAGRLIHLECNKIQPDPILVYFFDMYGLPQCVSLNKSQYQFDYKTLGSYRSFNDGLTYEYHKSGTYAITVGDSGYEKEFIPFLNGMVLSEGYWCQFNGTLVKCALTSVSTSIEKKEHNVAIVGKLEVNPTNALIVEPDFMEG